VNSYGSADSSLVICSIVFPWYFLLSSFLTLDMRTESHDPSPSTSAELVRSRSAAWIFNRSRYFSFLRHGTRAGKIRQSCIECSIGIPVGVNVEPRRKGVVSMRNAISCFGQLTLFCAFR